MQRKTKKRKLNKSKVIGSILVLIAFIGICVFAVSKLKTRDTNQPETSLTTTASSTSNPSSSESESKKADLPDAHQSDWNLILVNRENPKEELSPDLTTIDSVQVDSRIAEALTEFLAAAQAIDPSEHLISAYRSVAYQEQLFNGYVENEMVGAAGSVNNTGQAISREEAEANVKTYSQPAGSSEHQTGLAVDMSTIDALNQSPADVVEEVKKIAPNYGFVLRFPKGGKSSTGVDYEDWHFRYVGVENAKYMTKHNLTLEQYLRLLPE
ncbi:M15 family metallopeptidase [Lactococcus garvieae]|uniref:M15 family metallopeptidase n=1 Tax=Lactococcus garvieae TaxID=1363 RepID=UPI0009C15B87|nr:M15 family metallopeptidase [Lactococcus garvieae]